MTHPRGNLVVNGGFESGTIGLAPPAPWVSSNVVIVDAGANAHSGVQIASLGATTPTDPAFLYQDVTIAPGRFYELTFHVTGALIGSAGPIRAEARWLNADGRDLGSGLSAFVSGGNVGTALGGEWLAVFEVTGKSPPDAVKARLLFSRSDTLPPMLLDDVLFADQS